MTRSPNELDRFENRLLTTAVTAYLLAGFLHLVIGARFAVAGWSLTPIYVSITLVSVVEFLSLGVIAVHFHRRHNIWPWQTEAWKQQRRETWERRLRWFKRFRH